MISISEPAVIKRGFSEDHRGSLEFYNEVNLSNFKRFYIVSNPKKGTVRAWHGHKIESKLVKVMKGKFVISTVKIENWENPSKSTIPKTFEFDQDSGLLFIPPGYANGAINLEENCKIIYFSSLNLEDSINDDFRFPSQYWDPWADYSPQLYE